MKSPEWLQKAIDEGRATVGPGVNMEAVLAQAETRVADPRAVAGKSDDMSEASFQSLVIGLAQLHGWMVAHFRKVRVQRGNETFWETPIAADGKGFPDLILVRNGCLIAAELKVGKNTLTPEQKQWMEQLDRCQFSSKGWDGKSASRFMHSAVWRPEDWPKIEKILTEGAG